MKKGFTLIELLGVIIILLVIFIITIPAVNKVIRDSEETIYDTQTNRILNATYDYSLKNLSILPDKYQKNYVTLAELIHNGYIDLIVNPNTNKPFPQDYLISIENVGSKYRNNYKYAKKNGDYLYKIEFELMESENYNNNKPTLSLVDDGGVEISTKVDDYKYVSTIEKDSPFIDAHLVVKDSSDNVITDARKTENIIFNDTLVEDVDTSKVGIYKINYVVLSKDSANNYYAAILTWEVVITDEND